MCKFFQEKYAPALGWKLRCLGAIANTFVADWQLIARDSFLENGYWNTNWIPSNRNETLLIYNLDNSCQLYMYREQKKIFHDVPYLSSDQVQWDSKHGKDGQFLVQIKPARLSQTCDYKSAARLWYASSNDPIAHFATGYGTLSNSMATLQVGVSKRWIFANTIPKKKGMVFLVVFYTFPTSQEGDCCTNLFVHESGNDFVSWPVICDASRSDWDLPGGAAPRRAAWRLLKGWKPSFFRAGNSPNLFGETKQKPEAALGFLFTKACSLPRFLQLLWHLQLQSISIISAFGVLCSSCLFWFGVLICGSCLSCCNCCWGKQLAYESRQWRTRESSLCRSHSSGNSWKSARGVGCSLWTHILHTSYIHPTYILHDPTHTPCVDPTYILHRSYVYPTYILHLTTYILHRSYMYPTQIQRISYCEWGYSVTYTVHSPIYVRLVFGSRSTIVQ